MNDMKINNTYHGMAPHEIKAGHKKTMISATAKPGMIKKIKNDQPEVESAKEEAGESAAMEAAEVSGGRS